MNKTRYGSRLNQSCQIPNLKARSKIASMLRMEGEYRLGKQAVGAGCEDETN